MQTFGCIAFVLSQNSPKELEPTEKTKTFIDFQIGLMCPHKQTNIHHQLNQHPQQVNCDVPSSKSVIQLCHCRLSTHVQLSRVTTEKICHIAQAYVLITQPIAQAYILISRNPSHKRTSSSRNPSHKRTSSSRNPSHKRTSSSRNPSHKRTSSSRNHRTSVRPHRATHRTSVRPHRATHRTSVRHLAHHQPYITSKYHQETSSTWLLDLDNIYIYSCWSRFYNIKPGSVMFGS